MTCLTEKIAKQMQTSQANIQTGAESAGKLFLIAMNTAVTAETNGERGSSTLRIILWNVSMVRLQGNMHIRVSPADMHGRKI